jgi:hypothetical protein
VKKASLSDAFFVAAVFCELQSAFASCVAIKNYHMQQHDSFIANACYFYPHHPHPRHRERSEATLKETTLVGIFFWIAAHPHGCSQRRGEGCA